MPDYINGLPLHVLIIHVVVVLIPLGALFTVLCALWPAARRKLGFISPLTCLIALVAVPVATNAGEFLQDKIDPQGKNAAIEKHAYLGDTFLWYAIGLFIVSAVVWWLGRQYALGVVPSKAERVDGVAQERALPQVASIGIAVVAVVVSGVVVWQLYRVGDAGASATWGYVKDLKN